MQRDGKRKPGKRRTRLVKLMRLRRLMRFQWALRKIWACNKLWAALVMKPHVDARFE